eukprot:scaffold95100_cov19-Prasinocladus_malaysianus.AAC.1
MGLFKSAGVVENLVSADEGDSRDNRTSYRLEGEIVRVFPTGFIERPTIRYTEEEWESVMINNENWSGVCVEALRK